MDTSKNKTRARRFAMIATVPFTAIIIAMFRLGSPLAGQPSARHSFVFGNVEHWPAFVVQGFWPLDMIETGVSFYVMIYLMMVGMQHGQRDESVRGFAKMILGIIIAFGCLFSALGSTMCGWYFGLEFFGFGAVCVIVLAVVFGGLIGGMFFVSSRIAEAWNAMTPEARTAFPGVKLVRRVGKYLDADDR